MSYGFSIESFDGLHVFYGDHGVYPFEEQYLEMNNNYFPDALLSRGGSVQSTGMGQRNSLVSNFSERFANGDPSMILKAHCLGGPKSPDRQDFLVEIYKA